MLSKVFTRFIMFLSSYIPLMVLMAVISYLNEPVLNIPLISILLIIGVFSLAITLILIKFAPNTQTLGGVKIGERPETNITAYLIPYLTVFILISTSFVYFSPSNLAAFITLMLVQFILTNNNQVIVVNPMLTLCGYKLARIKYSQKGQFFEKNAFIKCSTKTGDDITAALTSDGLLIQSSKVKLPKDTAINQNNLKNKKK